MRRRLRRFLGVFLSLVLVLTLMPETCIKVKADTTGTVKGILTNDGTMYIVYDSNSYAVNGTYNEKTITAVYDCDGGNGAMADYESDASTPWYSDVSDIHSVVIGQGVTYIGKHSFENCSAMVDLTISSTVTKVEEEAFKDCDALTSVTIPGNVRDMGNGVFASCDKLEEVIIENGLGRIPSNAFQECELLTDITIPESIGSIGNAAFDNCRKIETIVIPQGVSRIGTGAFRCCEALKTIELPANITGILTQTFNECHSLTSVVFPEKIRFIEADAFRECYSLTSVTIPESVEEINNGAFWASGLRSVEFLSTDTQVADNVFMDVGTCIYTYNEQTGFWDSSTENVTPATLIIPDGFAAGTPDENHNWKGGLFTATIKKNVTLHTNGGTINSGNVISYLEGRETTLPTDVTKGGFIFGGWYANSECTGNAITKIAATETGAKEYWAKWQVRNYDDVPTEVGEVKDITGTNETIYETNPFSTKIENSNELATLLSLTDVEIAQGVNVWLDIQDMSNTVRAEDKEKIQEALGEYSAGMYLDVNLYKKVGNNAAVKLTETNGRVKISILIPQSHWKSGRDFVLIRLHDGVATVINGTYNETTHIFTFETDEFSTYAIAFKDTTPDPGPIPPNPPTPPYPPEPEVITYMVTFDANGGTYLGEKITLEEGRAYGFTYDPSKIYRQGYLFAGWYTDPVGGARIKSDTKFNGNVTTLYAHWIKVFTGKVWSFTARSYSKGRLTVRVEKPLTSVSGYEFEYSEDGVLWITKTKFIDKNDESATTMYFTNLTKGNYKVRVRAFRFDSTGAKIYGAWSKVITAPVK